jgi:hypothetical protein
MYFGGNKKFPIHLNTSEELEEGWAIYKDIYPNEKEN